MNRFYAKTRRPARLFLVVMISLIDFAVAEEERALHGDTMAWWWADQRHSACEIRASVNGVSVMVVRRWKSAFSLRCQRDSYLNRHRWSFGLELSPRSPFSEPSDPPPKSTMFWYTTGNLSGIEYDGLGVSTKFPVHYCVVGVGRSIIWVSSFALFLGWMVWVFARCRRIMKARRRGFGMVVGIQERSFSAKQVNIFCGCLNVTVN